MFILYTVSGLKSTIFRFDLPPERFFEKEKFFFCFSVAFCLQKKYLYDIILLFILLSR